MFTEFLELYIEIALAIFVYMNGWFLLSLLMKRNDIADLAWGLGFILVVIISIFSTEYYSFSFLTISILIMIWGFRLAFHISQRIIHHDNEDPRYAQWRKDWGKFLYVRSYFQVFILQGILLFLIAIPIPYIAIFGESSAYSLIITIGSIMWFIGFMFESVGDRQLKNFISDPENKGKICNIGLWSYTRHPNYFGEITMWWGIFFITLIVPTYWYLSLISPTVITLLILFVSGIPLSEKRMISKPGWDNYKNKVPVLLPWFPKK